MVTHPCGDHTQMCLTMAFISECSHYVLLTPLIISSWLCDTLVFCCCSFCYYLLIFLSSTFFSILALIKKTKQTYFAFTSRNHHKDLENPTLGHSCWPFLQTHIAGRCSDSFPARTSHRHRDNQRHRNKDTQTHTDSHIATDWLVHKVLQFLYGLRLPIFTARQNFTTLIDTDDSICRVHQKAPAEN